MKNIHNISRFRWLSFFPRNELRQKENSPHPHKSRLARAIDFILGLKLSWKPFFFVRSHISSQKSLHEEELEAVIEKFFRNLFPLAYHHAVHSRDADEESMARDFHVDYKNCLEKSYDVLQPFGEIPASIIRMLVQSVGSANVLLRSLEHGGKIVGETESLPIDMLSVKCQHALLKMNYCASCKGHNYHHSRPCYGYCSNVVR